MLLKVYNIVFLTKITKGGNMKRNTTKPDLPALTEDILTDPQVCTDNMFADMWKSLKMNTLLNKAGFKKRSGTPINSVVFLLLLWVWLGASGKTVFTRFTENFLRCQKRCAL